MFKMCRTRSSSGKSRRRTADYCDGGGLDRILMDVRAQLCGDGLEQVPLQRGVLNERLVAGSEEPVQVGIMGRPGLPQVLSIGVHVYVLVPRVIPDQHVVECTMQQGGQGLYLELIHF